jgi:hypothetical protein
MRKRILRTVLPLMAFMLAAAFAFATDQKSSNDDAMETLYIFRNDQCEKITWECNNQSSTPCEYEGYQVYRYGSTTACSVPLTHQPE